MSFKATSHISLRKDGEVIEAVSLGDGPIDSSFKSIESVVGKHYELDDFRIRRSPRAARPWASPS